MTLPHYPWLLLTVAAVGLLATTSAEGANKATRARRHFERGQRHAELGRFTEAIEAFEKAYELKPVPALLFNIGQCHKYAKNYERAIYFFETYLRRQPTGPESKIVRKELREAKMLQEEIEAAAQAPPREPAPVVTDEPPESDAAPATPEGPSESPPAEATPSFVEPPPAALAETVEPEPIWNRWWFWTGIGVVAVGAGVAGYFILKPEPKTVPPAGSLGTVDLRP